MSAKRTKLKLLAAGHPEQCWYCCRPIEAAKLTVDHLVPKFRGGRSKGNTVLACRNCNHRKGPLTVLEFLEHRGNRARLSQLVRDRSAA